MLGQALENECFLDEFATPKHASKIYVTSFIRRDADLEKMFKSISEYRKYIEQKNFKRHVEEENSEVNEEIMKQFLSFPNSPFTTKSAKVDHLNAKGMFPSVPVIGKVHKTKNAKITQ